MSTTLRNWLIFAMVVIVVAVVGYRTYVSPYEPTAEARAALASTGDVIVTTEPELTFTPTSGPRAGFVFYTGARVPPEAYAPLLRDVAAAGYLVVAPKMPFNLAFLGQSRAADAIEAHPEIETWAVGGHSLGGAMAASFADSSTRIRGLILVGADPGASIDLSLRSIHTTVIYGTNDTAVLPEDVLASESRLPEGRTDFVEIAGGNHAQFGSYSVSDGGGDASISAEQQRSQTRQAVVDLLREID